MLLKQPWTKRRLVFRHIVGAGKAPHPAKG
jgi:hypothetical protein